MNKRRTIAILLTFVMLLSVMASACSKKPQTLEEYIKNDSESMEQVQNAADSAGLNVEFKENDVIYTYDLSTIDGVTEDIVKSDVMKEQLSSALDSTADTFSGLCKQLEEQSKIEGIKIVVEYKYGDEIIVTKTFNSSGAVE